jgi:predicted MPP superfamily phosphohydrolase
MSAPEFIQQLEGWCASVENSTGGLMAIGAVVSVGNLLVFRALLKRLPVHPLLIGVPYWLLCAPMLAMAIFGPAAPHAVQTHLPGWLAVACMTFQFAIWVYGGCLLIAALCVLPARALRTRQPAPKPEHEPDAERRTFLRKAAFGFPAIVLTTAAAGGISSQLPPVIRRVRQPVRGDYSALRGMKLVQFSDVHIGSYLERDRLTEIAEAVNAQRPDIVVCTGDLIDNRLDQLEHAGEMLRQLKPRVGAYMCMGNHEYIAAGGDECAVKDAYAEFGVNVLVDESHKITVHGSHLWLAGTDFPGHTGGPLGDRPSTAQSLDRALADMRDDGAPRIVLSHHPKTFFEGRERQIDLMLSGHTHGGQISLGRIDDHELTPNLPFEFYHKGLYEHRSTDSRQAPTRLYVNSGIGSWLPVRLNCPPEITVVELV